MIICHSIIYKIITLIEGFADQLETSTFVQWLFSETGACEGMLWNFFSVEETRDEIIYLMHRKDLPCWIIISTDTFLTQE